jgi:hypothetical protein
MFHYIIDDQIEAIHAELQMLIMNICVCIIIYSPIFFFSCYTTYILYIFANWRHHMRNHVNPQKLR